MKTISTTAAILLSVAALAVVMGLSPMSTSSRVPASAAAKKAAKFHGHFKGTFILAINGGTAGGTISANGKTTALGRSALHATASGPAVLFGCTKVTGTGRVDGRQKNRVNYSFQVQFCVGSSQDKGTFTLTKGRGTMAGVRGSGTFMMSPSGLTNPIPVTLDLSGTYRLPKR